ncbi:MAG: hypothetical protein AB4038_01835 [Prochloraceae cyanobacterium]
MLQFNTEDAKIAGDACLGYSYSDNNKKAEFQRDRDLAISNSTIDLNKVLEVHLNWISFS